MKQTNTIFGDGFTLIETLVAIMVLSVSMTVIMQLFSGGLRSNRITADYTRAIFYARDRMEETLISNEFLEGVETGVFDDKYAWKVTMGPAPDDERFEPEVAERMPVERWRIEVSVSWRDGMNTRTFDINTLALQPRRASDEEED